MELGAPWRDERLAGRGGKPGIPRLEEEQDEKDEEERDGGREGEGSILVIGGRMEGRAGEREGWEEERVDDEEDEGE